MKKRLLILIIMIVSVCSAFFVVSGCSKNVPGGSVGDNGSGAFELDAASVKIEETENGPILSWGKLEDAISYSVTVNGKTAETRICVMNLASANYGFVLPANGKLEATIVAKSFLSYDSPPATITYTAEGVRLKSPIITNFENETLEWTGGSRAKEYVVTVATGGGAPVPVAVSGNTLNLRGYLGSCVVSITAHGDGTWFKDSDSVSVNVNSAHTALVLAPVNRFNVEDGRLSWQAVGGASAYKVVDLDRSVTIVEETFYEISGPLGDKNIVYGVYPVSDSDIFEDAEIVPVDIPYLQGDGTAASPYLIKTAFDLRAIDYYEARYAEKIITSPNTPKNFYRIEADIDYSTITPDDSGVSNIYTLAKPFYGTLDGNGKTLSNIFVAYDGGYWALFDMITPGATVKNIKFDKPIIINLLQKSDRPLKATVATVAYRNYGRIENVTVSGAKYTAAGGEVSGIATHNYSGGVVTGCTVKTSTFMQHATGQTSQACYEMAGVVLENYGEVSANTVDDLSIIGSAAKGDDGGSYNIVRTAGGIVSVNRAGGVVSANKYNKLVMKNMLNDYGQNGNGGGFEFGGLVAYNAGTVTVGSAAGIGSFEWGATNSTSVITRNIGVAIDLRGKHVGKNDGTVN